MYCTLAEIETQYCTLAGIGSAACIGCDGKMFRVSACSECNNQELVRDCVRNGYIGNYVYVFGEVEINTRVIQINIPYLLSLSLPDTRTHGWTDETMSEAARV
jgi:hypothetical protein